MCFKHCGKSVCIRSYSGWYFSAFKLNLDQSNSEYEHFLHNEMFQKKDVTDNECHVFQIVPIIFKKKYAA